jgi:hypothetical protein
MSPKPEMDVADMSAGGPVKMTSPTSITNSIPRPKSPRRLDFRGGSSKKSAPEFLAAANFSRAYDGTKDPKVRRRPHGDMGHFDTVGEHRGWGHTGTSEVSEQTPGCMNLDVSGFMNKSASACVSKSKTYANRYGPTAKQNALKCVTDGARVAGYGMSEFAMTSAEVYRVECKSDHRSDDSEFFKDQEYSQGEGNSLAESKGFSEGRSRDSKDEPSPLRPKSKIGFSEGRSRDSKDEPSPRRPKSKIGFSEGRSRDSKEEASPLRPKSKIETSPSPRGVRFPQAIHIMKDPAEEMEFSPPRVDRVDTSKWQPKTFPKSLAGAEDFSSLRTARLELFRQGQMSDVTEPEKRLVHALEALNQQDSTIERLKEELDTTKTTMENATKELEVSRSTSQKRQFTATEVRAQAVQERKRVEALYEMELAQNKKLQSNISKLQVENSSLKVSLRSAGTRRPTGIPGFKDAPRSPDKEHSPARSAQLISFRAEIVDLRSQLAEAHASKIEDTSSLARHPEFDDLKNKMQEVQSELETLREKQLEFRRSEDLRRQTEALVKQELERSTSINKAAKAKLEEELKSSIVTENETRVELIKMKANMQRLQRERSRKRLHSVTGDEEKLQRLLKEAEEDASKLEKQLFQAQNISKSETSTLQNEIADLKKKLSEAGQDSAVKTTEDPKLQKDLVRPTQEMKAMETKMASQEEKLRTQTEKIGSLERQVRARGSRGATYAETSQVSLLEDELEFRKANEASLRAEMRLQKTLLNEARTKLAKAESNTDRGIPGDASAIAALRFEIEELKHNSSKSDVTLRSEIKRLKTEKSDSNIEQLKILQRDHKIESATRQEVKELRARLAEFEASAQLSESPQSPEEKAKKQSMLNEICMLKVKVSDYEARSTEERFRAEEEQRISREKDIERVEALERLRQEKERASELETRFQAQIARLKLQLAYSPPKASEQADSAPEIVESKVDGEEEPPTKLTRLRSDLALARARLETAREESRTISREASIFDSPGRSIASVQSHESTWAPPSKDEEDESLAPLPSEPRTPPRTIVTKGSGLKRIAKAVVFKTEPEDTAVKADSGPKTESDGTEKKAYSARASGSEEPEKLAISPQKEAAETEKQSDSGPAVVPEKAEKKSHVAEIKRQLLESSKRLSQANSKLEGLVRASHEVADESSNLSPRESYLKIVMASPNAEKSDDLHGTIHEVMANDPDSEGIEVSGRQFADI